MLELLARLVGRLAPAQQVSVAVMNVDIERTREELAARLELSVRLALASVG